MSESNNHKNSEETESKQKKYPGLIPFKKGQSGNPKGRPKGTVSITEQIRARMHLYYKEEKQATVIGDNGKKILQARKTYMEKIIEAIFENAIKNKDNRTLNQIWAYMDGHPKATLDIGADKQSIGELTEFFRAIGASKSKKP